MKILLLITAYTFTVLNAAGVSDIVSTCLVVAVAVLLAMDVVKSAWKVISSDM